MTIHFHRDFTPKRRSVQHPSVCLEAVFVCRDEDILGAGQSGEIFADGQLTSASKDVFIISVCIDDVIGARDAVDGAPIFKIRSPVSMFQHCRAGKIPHLHMIAKSDDMKRLINSCTRRNAASPQTIGADASSIKLVRAIVLSFDGMSCRNRLFVENAATALLLNLIARWSPVCTNGNAQLDSEISASHE